MPCRISSDQSAAHAAGEAAAAIIAWYTARAR
jgi:hypothetical protein